MKKRIKITWLKDQIVDETYTFPEGQIYYMSNNNYFSMKTENGKTHQFYPKQMIENGFIKMEEEDEE